MQVRRFVLTQRETSLVGYDRSSLSCYVWLTEHKKLVEPSRVTCDAEERILDLVVDMAVQHVIRIYSTAQL